MGKPATAAAPAPIRPLSTNQRVVLWARGKLGRQVGRGECWDLAEHALRQADALTSNDLMTKVEDDSDYVWGDAVEHLKDVRPGDILQFRDHRVVETVTTVARFPDGASAEETEETSMSRGHHTAIVEHMPDADGAIGTLDQHVKPLGKVVQRKTLYTREHRAGAGAQTDVEAPEVEEAGDGKRDHHPVVGRHRQGLGLPPPTEVGTVPVRRRCRRGGGRGWD